MSKINIRGLDQYGTEPFEQQQFGPADDEGVKDAAALLQDLLLYGQLFYKNVMSTHFFLAPFCHTSFTEEFKKKSFLFNYRNI